MYDDLWSAVWWFISVYDDLFLCMIDLFLCMMIYEALYDDLFQCMMIYEALYDDLFQCMII